MFLHIAIFVLSCLGIIFASRWVISALSRTTRALGWKEFVVAFFAASVGAVLPELFIGIKSAIKGVPELAFGNIIGQNLILFTFSAGICAIILKEIPVQSKTVRSGAMFSLLAVTLPFILIYNGELSRIDGLILIAAFVLYVRWLFKDEDRFIKNYEDEKPKEKENLKSVYAILRDAAIVIGSFLLLIFAAEGIISSAGNFASYMGVSLGVVGIFIVGAGVALPETFFAVRLALKGHSWMILGGLTGAISISSTLVLGLVALINPIVIDNFDPYSVARFFLILSALVFWFFITTHNVLTKREAVFLFLIYLLFLFFEFVL